MAIFKLFLTFILSNDMIFERFSYGPLICYENSEGRIIFPCCNDSETFIRVYYAFIIRIYYEIN